MRLQLIKLVGGCLLVASACHAVQGEQVRGGVHHLVERGVTVSTPRVEGTVGIGESTRVTPHWTADFISAATPLMNAPDTVTRATEYSEVRHESGVDIVAEPTPSSTLAGGYIVSVEPDYVSHTLSASADRELLERAATLGGGARVSIDEVGTSDDPAFERRLTVAGWTASWSHILNRKVVVLATYDAEYRTGYQANPYRYVPVGEGAGGPRYAVPERVPERRSRHAMEAMGVWAAPARVFLRASYRFYADDWGISSHTGQLEAWRAFFADRLRLQLHARGYRQSAARFYQQRYAELTAWRTGDPRLSPMSTATGGARVDVRLDRAHRVTLSTGYAATLYSFDNYAPWRRATGHTLGVSLALAR